LGRAFGAGPTEAELDGMRAREGARGAEDAPWRRSKLGLRLSPPEAQAVADWFGP
jgi:glycerol-3-phosphate dehydrogenase